MESISSAAGGVPRPSRPFMPAGYGLATTPPPAELVSWQDAAGKLAAARNYWVATSGRGGRPHVMPVWGLWIDQGFVFSTSRSSRKGRNLLLNGQIAVHLESGDDVVVLEGVVEELHEASILTRYVDAYDEKYQIRPDTADTDGVVYLLRPRVAFSWLESDFPQTAARWQF